VKYGCFITDPTDVRLGLVIRKKHPIFSYPGYENGHLGYENENLQKSPFFIPKNNFFILLKPIS
jgi:hypothetical protein